MPGDHAASEQTFHPIVYHIKGSLKGIAVKSVNNENNHETRL
jgi:hypothetical protein